MKTCTKCGEEKPAGEFYRRPSGSPAAECKACSRARARDSRLRDGAQAARDRDRARYAANRDLRRAQREAWRVANPGRDEETKRRSRLRRYGLTPERWATLLAAQDGRCAICRTAEPGGKGDWHIDHDHACCPGRRSCGACVRGLLCHGCNVGIGSLRDDPAILRSAADYLTPKEPTSP